jgi:hypothetical protein
MLRDLLENQSSAKPLLPISHITDWSSVEGIISCGFIRCAESEERRICFSYGPPLYKVKSSSENERTN